LFNPIAADPKTLPVTFIVPVDVFVTPSPVELLPPPVIFPVIVRVPEDEQVTAIAPLPAWFALLIFPTIAAEFVPESVTRLSPVCPEFRFDVNVTPFESEYVPPAVAVAVPPSFHTLIVADKFVSELDAPRFTDTSTVTVKLLE
jgi:hypothetical protein